MFATTENYDTQSLLSHSVAHVVVYRISCVFVCAHVH